MTTNGQTEKNSPTRTSRIQQFTERWDAILHWDTAEDLGEFHDLVQNPPLRSVVVHVGPDAAEQLLALSNEQNRPLSANHVRRLGSSFVDEDYALTGDTIKFSKSGRMLDGQHRMRSCVNRKRAILTHMVFGLDEDVFDVIDQGKKRTAADILALAGVEQYALVAAAVAWVVRLQSAGTGAATMDGGAELSPRQIRRLATGEMARITDHAAHAILISKAFKHPPSMIAAILYLIGKRKKALAEEFVQEWVNGAKIGRNEAFNVLSQRLLAVAHQSGGHINRMVRAAFVVQTFNHWNAGEVPSPRSLSWRKGQKFPPFVFDKEQFLKRKREAASSDTSLNATQLRVLATMGGAVDAERQVQMSMQDLAEASNTPLASIPYILRALSDEGAIFKVRAGAGRMPAVYRINVPDEDWAPKVHEAAE